MNKLPLDTRPKAPPLGGEQALGRTGKFDMEAAAPKGRSNRSPYIPDPIRLAKSDYVDSGLLHLGPTSKTKGGAITEDRLYPILPILEKYYEHWLAYPDKLVELLSSSEKSFKLYPFQQFALRIAARYQKSMQVAARGYSKSFSNVLSRFLDSILLPRSKVSLLAEHKTQATKIATEKFDELFDFIPALGLEVNEKKGSKTVASDIFIRKVLKNKSQFDIVGIENSTRGGRRHSLLFEEIKDLEADKINGNVLPLLNIARRTEGGDLNTNEKHQKQVYVGSAGYVDTFAHDKAIEIMVDAVIRPDKAFYWGGDYKIPVYYGLLSEDFVEDLKSSPSYDEADFLREFGAKWSNQIEGSFFDYDRLRGLRTLQRAETKASKDPNVFYVASVDVGRSKAQSVLEIFKVRRGEEYFTKSLVNIVLMPGRHFLAQSCTIKQYDLMFDFETVVIDGNGMGVGLIDFLTISNIDPVTNTTYAPWAVQNIDEYPDYKKDELEFSQRKIHVLKTGLHNAGLIHSLAYNELYSGKVKLLVDEKEARAKFLLSKKGQSSTLEERRLFLKPYLHTSLLLRETSNLAINRTSAQLKLERIRHSEEKDTFSALEYGLWVIAAMEKKHYSKGRRKKRSLASFMFAN